MKWTREQTDAIIASHDTLLVAGAGTGKTTTVVGKILWLLGLDVGVSARSGRPLPPPPEPIRLHQVAAITFTEKAAHDLKRKLREEIEERAPDLRWDIDRAFVGTIHSFCGSLLREHALRFGIDPGFRVLDERQARVEQDEVIREAVLEALETVDDDDPLAALARTVPLRDRSEHGTGLIDLVRQTLRDARWHAERYARWWQGGDLDGEMLRQACPTWTDVLDDDALGACRALVRMAMLARDRWQAWMERENARDFDAMILDARELLLSEQGAAALEAVRRRYRILIIDEFQDTDAAQRDIAFAIGGLPHGAGAKPAAAPQLFFVGDPKQSIYRFRGADIAVWNQVERALADIAAPLSLSENFRSQPAVIDFVNTVGAEAMADAGRQLGTADPAAVVEYRPLVPARDRADHGRVEWLQADGDTAKERRPVEAEHVAARIRQMVGNEFVTDPETGERRRCAHRDIAVLFRSRGGLEEYEDALRRHAVPYYYQGSGGLAGKLEVLDLVNALRVMDNPADDLRAFAYLRSPFVGLRDEMLARIRLAPQIDRDHAERPYLATLLDAARWFLGRARAGEIDWHDALVDGRTDTRVADIEQDALERGLAAIDEAIALAHRRPIDEVLERLLDHTGYRDHLLLFGDAREPLSRIQAFLRLAEEHRDLPIGTFLEMWDGWDDSDQGVPQSPLYSAADDVVTLTTIHSAKGLEWPIVFLIEAGRSFKDQFTGDFWSDDQLGPLRAPKKDERGERAARIHERRRLHERAEEARLLYVATTRARDRLIVVGPPGVDDAYSAWLSSALPKGQDPAPPLALVDADSGSGTAGAAAPEPVVSPEVHVGHRPPSLPDARARAVPDPSLAWLEAVEGVAGGEQAAAFPLLAPLPEPPLRFLTSATERMMKRQRPEEWELRYVHAVEPVWRFAPDPRPAQSGRLPADVRGTLIHGVLERIREEAELASVLEEAISDLDAPELGGMLEAGSRYRAALEEEIRRVIRDPEWRWYVEGRHHRELAFLHLTGEREWLYGKFDLYRPSQLSAAVARAEAASGVEPRPEDGIGWVIDFKTHKVATLAEARAVAAKYEVQCEVYRAAAAELAAEPVRVRLHFTQPNLVVES